METTELKSHLHELIDQLDNREILNDYLEEMQSIVNISKSGIWNSLSGEQRQQVLLAAKECEDPANLVDNEIVMGKYKRWLTK